MRFCDKLPKVRKENNYSQEQLADKMGVSRQAVSKWESGVSYPDMDKMLQLCTILNCNLEDLMDDGKVGKANINNKINFSKYLDDLLKFITKTYNMFCSMKTKNVFTCFVEMLFIFLLLMLFGNIIYGLANSITNAIVNVVPHGYLNFLNPILSSIYSIILIVLGIVIFIHLFKVRYLDYYVTIEDNNSVEKTLEEPLEKVELNNKHEKVIIRDPKHSSPSFFDLLGRIIAFCIKCFIVMIGLGFIGVMAGLLFMFAISVSYIAYSALFIYGALAIIGILLINYVFVELICRFIFDRKQNFKRCFILGLIGLVVGSCGLGLFFVKLMNFKFVESDYKVDKKTVVETISMNNNTMFEPEFMDFDSVEYVEDNSLSDKIKIELTFSKYMTYGIHKSGSENDEYDCYYVFSKGENFEKSYMELLEGLKQGIIRKNDSSGYIKIKISTSNDNYKKLINNYNKFNDIYDE